MRKEKYFAHLAEKQIGNSVIELVKKFYNHVQTVNLLELWRNVNRTYYSGYFMKGSIGSYAGNDAMRKIEINHFRNIVDHMIVKIGGQKEQYTPRARNADYTSTIQTNLANIILDYYATTHGMNDKHNDALLKSLHYGDSGVSIEWDPEAYEGQGDIVAHTYGAIDVIRDYCAPSIYACNWYICRQFRNKWDMAAKYGAPVDGEDEAEADKRKEKIESMGIDQWTKQYMINQEYSDDSINQVVPVYVLYHKKTAAVPEGLRVTVLSDGTVLTYDKLNYKEFPFIPLECYHQDGTSFGYSPAYDLLAIQRANNGIKSIILSNANAYGKPTVMLAEGSNISTSQIMQGYNIVRYNPGVPPPALLNMLQIPGELYKASDDYNKDMELISAISSVTRGNPEYKLSGSAYALLESKSIEYYTILDRNYVNFRQKTMTAIFETFKQYASVPRALPVVGKDKQSAMKDVKGEDVRDVCRVDVVVSNPIERTITGRQSLLEIYAKHGVITTPQQVVEVMTSGRVENLTDTTADEFALAKKENEYMMNGELPAVLATDDHFIHVPEHKKLSNDPELRKQENGDKLKLINDHILRHIDLYSDSNPALNDLLGIRPPSQPTPPEPPSGQAGEVPQEQVGDEQPRMPTNPLSGREFNNQTGGIGV